MRFWNLEPKSEKYHSKFLRRKGGKRGGGKLGCTASASEPPGAGLADPIAD